MLAIGEELRKGVEQHTTQQGEPQMIAEELNAVALKAKTNKNAMWSVKAYYIPLIEELAQKNWYKMNNETHFIDDCNRKIEYAVRTFNIHKGNFDRRVRVLINQSVRQYCGNRGRKRKVLQLIGENLDALQIIDNTVSVEVEAMDAVVKEELYEKYCDKEVDKSIMRIVLDEDYVEIASEIARQLAKRTGRTFHSARGAVRTFIRCKRDALLMLSCR